MHHYQQKELTDGMVHCSEYYNNAINLCRTWDDEKSTMSLKLSPVLERLNVPYFWQIFDTIVWCIRMKVVASQSRIWRSTCQYGYARTNDNLVLHTRAKIRNLSKNSDFENFMFYKIHISKISFLTRFTFLKSQFFIKFTISKSHFSQNSHFSNIKYLVISE